MTAQTVELSQAIDVINPMTGNLLSSVPIDTPGDVAAAFERARAAQVAWAETPFRQRARIMIRLHDILLRDIDEIMSCIQQESGKAQRDAFSEIFAVTSELRYYAYHGGRHLRPHRAGPLIPLRNSTRVAYTPYGVVGIISPFNYPLVMAVSDAIPALLAGNAVVQKPSEQVPLTPLLLREKAIEAGLHPGLLQYVNGMQTTAEALIDHADYVMFTGGERGGLAVATRAAAQMTPFTMELGGKNAAIVLDDAPIRSTAITLLDGAFGNTGQICLTWERAYIPRSIYDDLVARLVTEIGRIRISNTLDGNADYGGLISLQHLGKVNGHVEDAVSKGAEVLAGGKTRPDIGPTVFEPTLLADVTPDMDVFEQETFGPVLSVYPYDTVEEAIHEANRFDTGLNFGVFGGNVNRAMQVARRLQAGTVTINESSYYVWGAVDAPLGGFKRSGVGRRHSASDIRKYTQPQTILINHTRIPLTSGESPMAMNSRFQRLLTLGLKIWRHIPFLR